MERLYTFWVVKRTLLDTIADKSFIVLRSLGPASKSANAGQRVQELENLVEQARDIASERIKIEDSISEGSSLSDDESVSGNEENSDVVPELRSQIRHLVELGPTI